MPKIKSFYQNKPRMRILVVGGGASGVSTALALKELDQTVDVELWEARDVLGGMASSAQTPEGEWFNNGVQGVHESFVHTRALMGRAGFGENTMQRTSLTSCFVTQEGTWISGTTNLSEYKRSISNFMRMCRAAVRVPRFFALWRVVDACALFAVSRRFVNAVVLPTLALFFGTGNQVRNVPATLAGQVFSGKGAVTLFDADPTRFIVTTRANMLALPPLRFVYESLGRVLQAAGVRVITGRGVRSLSNKGRVVDSSGNSHTFDRVVLACQVPDMLRMLPPSHRAVKTLSKVRYYRDMSVTHRDAAHMRRHFHYEENERINYFIRERSAKSMDMGFALHRYQRVTPPLFQTLWLQGPDGQPDRAAPINPDLVVREDEWLQVGHTVRHFIRCVANVHRLQGPFVFFAGSWTLINSHEVAVMSGIVAAQTILNTRLFPSATFGKSSVSFRMYEQVARP